MAARIITWHSWRFTTVCLAHGCPSRVSITRDKQLPVVQQRQGKALHGCGLPCALHFTCRSRVPSLLTCFQEGSVRSSASCGCLPSLPAACRASCTACWFLV